TRAPHHDAVVEQRAVAFAQAGHLLHHVGELGDVEGGDGGDLADAFTVVVVMRHRVMHVAEAQLRIGYAVRGRADVRADAGHVGLECQYGQVAHDLHVFAAFVPFGNLDFNRRRIFRLELRGTDARPGQGGFLLALFDDSNATLDGADA